MENLARFGRRCDCCHYRVDGLSGDAINFCDSTRIVSIFAQNHTHRLVGVARLIGRQQWLIMNYGASVILTRNVRSGKKYVVTDR
jgi:hypothetical protein